MVAIEDSPSSGGVSREPCLRPEMLVARTMAMIWFFPLRDHDAGAAFVRPPAYAMHAPLTGWRFLAWRALVTGRDADRKYTDMKSGSRLLRLLHAVRFFVKMECRAIRRAGPERIPAYAEHH